jgi:tRNA(Arg) A34 adenosine deaminase TadA
VNEEPWRTVRRERDALAFLGLLARMHLRFDAEVAAQPPAAPTHTRGYNIHALVVDNPDGEVLAIDENTIHGDESPVQHAEQRALRQAVARTRAKRPRATGEIVEDYYRLRMFTAPGAADGDFVRLGSTLYSTLEPCPMCATTLLVCRVKRLVFVVPDRVYGGIWHHAKEKYYPKYELRYDALALDGIGVAWLREAAALHATVLEDAEKLRAAGVRDTHLFDRMPDVLRRAAAMLARVLPSDVSQEAGSIAPEGRNVRTLSQLQAACGLERDSAPTAGASLSG